MFNCIQNLLSFGADLAVILGIIFVVIQILQTGKIARADHDRREKQSTIEFYNALSTESYDLYDIFGNKPIDISSIDSNKVLKESVIKYLGRLERLAVGVNSKIYNFDILNFMCGQYLIERYYQFEKYIEKARHGNNKICYKEFEILVKNIKEHRERNPEQTIDKCSIVEL